MTRFAIITDTARHVKMAIIDARCTPLVAVNDPVLMLGMPKGEREFFLSFFLLSSCSLSLATLRSLSFLLFLLTPTPTPTTIMRKKTGLTAATGLDALTHAVAAYVSTASTPVTDASALHAIRLISRHLVTAVEEPKNMEAREQMA